MSWKREKVSSFVPTPHPERLFSLSVTLVSGFDLLWDAWSRLRVAASNPVQQVEKKSWTVDQLEVIKKKQRLSPKYSRKL